jgi:ribosomal protein S18 acetylase RimI-like enzyme
VSPALQGAGVGSALLSAAEERTRALGLAEVEMTVLSVRTELIAYYARRGYLDTGETAPFPYGLERNGRPRRPDLVFAVLRKAL